MTRTQIANRITRSAKGINLARARVGRSLNDTLRQIQTQNAKSITGLLATLWTLRVSNQNPPAREDRFTPRAREVRP